MHFYGSNADIIFIVKIVRTRNFTKCILDDEDLPDILLRYAASELVFLQSWMLFTCRVRSSTPAEPEASIGRAEICLHAEQQVPACTARSVYLQNQTHSSYITRNSLCVEPRAVSMTRPDAHNLSHTNMDMERDLKV